MFTACLVLATLAIQAHRPLLAGMALGYAVVTRLGGVLLLPAFVIYLWLRSSDDTRWTMDDGAKSRLSSIVYRLSCVVGGRPAFLRECLRLAPGGLPFALAILGYNWVRFGTLTERG